MKIVIVGAGFTGTQLAKLLVKENNQVALIDNDEDVIRHASNQVDCETLCSEGNNLEILESVGIAKADALVCVTSSDEVNMITCSLVDAVYPDILKIARVRNYSYYINTTKAQKKHANDFSGKRRPLYGINYMIHPDVEAANAIVEAVSNGAIGNVTTFENSNLEIARLMVSQGSDLDGISLKEIRSKTDVKLLVAYVEKDGETSLPSGDTVINAGDTIGILINKKDIADVISLTGAETNDLRKIVLIGAGRIGTIIAEKLMPKRNLPKIFSTIATKHSRDFVIVDNDELLAKAAADRFADARVMCADASDDTFLHDEGLNNFDLAICTTHNHELNMVLAAYLESLGVKQSIALVTSAQFATIADKLGVDVPVPFRDVIVDSIMSHLRGKSVKGIHTVTNGDLEIVECEVTSESKATGKTLKEIADPGTYLLLMSRKSGIDEFKIADGNTTIYTGDHVVLITEVDNSKKILSYFTGKN